METELIPLSMLNAFVYCPRRFYYEFVLGVMESNEQVEEGRIAHEAVDAAEGAAPKRENDAIKTPSVYLSSEKFGIVGKVDLVEETADQCRPVEFKKRKAPRDDQDRPFVWENDQVQVCSEALLLEDNGLGPVQEGYLYYVASKSRAVIPITTELKETTLNVIKAAKALAIGGAMPPPLVSDPRCIHCSLLPICIPEETVALIQEPGKENLHLKLILPNRHDTSVVYVQKQGCYIQRKGETLVVKGSDGVAVQEIPVVNIRQVVAFGQIQVSSQTMELLFQRDIPLVFLSVHGRFKGVATGIPSKNSLLRIAQFDCARDEQRSLSLARTFVKAKVHNQRVILMRQGRGVESDTKDEAAEEGKTGVTAELKEQFSQAAARMKLLSEDAQKADNLDSLLGFEGMAAREYFGLFGSMLRNDPDVGFHFESRNKRPPKDPVNALLSFVYALLAKDCFSACLAVGFDPYVGFYHQNKYGRPSLALDLMEEFRPTIGDSVVLYVINNRIIDRGDFLFGPEACYLNQAGRKKLFEAYESRLNTLITHPLFGYRISYSRIIETQARILSRVITGEIPAYPGFEVR